MAEILKNNSYMALPSSIKRGNPASIDVTEVWYSYEEMVNYAKENATAYVGQKLSLVDEAAGTAKIYLIKNVAGDLEEIGASVASEVTNLTSRVEAVESDIADLESNKANAADVHTKTEITEIVSDLEDSIAEKANADDVYTKSEVYTKTEADSAIAAKVAAAEHLKRKIFDTKDLAQEFVDANPDTADQYIYMIPSGLQLDSNRYYEYMVLEGVLEQVGNWEVDLSDYFTQDEVKELLEDYYTSAQVDGLLAVYAKSSDLENYYTVAQIDELLEAHYTAEEIDTLIANYYTSAQVDEKLAGYVPVETGKSLVSNTEIAKLATVEENAEENYIKSVSSDFSVSAEGELSLNPLAIEDVAGLQKALDDKVEKVYYSVPVVDENGDPVLDDEGNPTYEQIEGGLLSPEDKEKLDALVITEGGVQISGTVNASNVKGLGAWITDNRNSVNGLLSTSNENKLNSLAEINSVNEDEFTITAEKELQIASIPVAKITNLEDLLNAKADGATVTELSDKVTNIEDALNNYVLKTEYESKMASIDGDITLLKDAVIWRALEE